MPVPSMYSSPFIRSPKIIMRMLGHVIVKLPAHRDGGSWSGCMWVDVCGLVSNNTAAQKLVVAFCCRPPMPPHLYIVNTSRNSFSSFKPLWNVQHLSSAVQACIHSTAAPSLDSPSSPSAHLSCAGPRRLVSVFCDDPLLCNTGIASRRHVLVTCI